MIIYKDIFTGDELLSDSFKMKLVDDVAYEVECSLITEGGVDVDIGANPLEGEEEVSVDCKETVIDLVYALRLEETCSFTKKQYISYIKGYMKRVKEELSKTTPERIKAFEEGASKYVKKILSKIDDFQCYSGESMDPEAMIILIEYRNDGKKPFAILWKDGLREQKL